MGNLLYSGDLTTPEMWDSFWQQRDSKTIWNRFTNSYGVAAIHKGRINSTLKLLLGEIGSKSANVIELGCAPGRILAHMAQLYPQHQYHGLDYAKAGIEKSKESLGLAGFNCTIHHGDIKTFEPPRKYDLVVSYGLIEHFVDPLPILKSHQRFCIPGGQVAITIPNYAHPITKWFIQRLDPEALETHVLGTMNEHVISQLFRQAGFDNVRVGSCGGPRLRSACTNPTASQKTLRTIARAWNMMSCVLPRTLLWSATIWGIGKVSHRN